MKTTDKIKLNTTVKVLDKDGTVIDAPETRTVRQEIDRLRHAGSHEAANRLESSCDDTHLDMGEYNEVNPCDPVDDKGKPKLVENEKDTGARNQLVNKK